LHLNCEENRDRYFWGMQFNELSYSLFINTKSSARCDWNLKGNQSMWPQMRGRRSDFKKDSSCIVLSAFDLFICCWRKESEKGFGGSQPFVPLQEMAPKRYSLKIV